jgi:carbohydrate-selective porin OprB
VANGLRFDRRVFVDRGDVVEGEIDVSPGGHQGAIRALNFFNHSRAGTYAQAIHQAEATGTTPDVTATSRAGTLKYGFGLSMDQEIWNGVGVFSRLGWNDGKTQSFAFSVIDRLASGGISVDGRRWGRPGDIVAGALTVTGLSGVHVLYLARGGLDFMIGDGALKYGTEYTFESYYQARLIKGVFAGLDLQHVTNPAYNRDRGPVWIGSLRVHVEWGTGGR